MDDGSWQTIKQTNWNFCKDLISKKGKFHSWKKNFFKDLPQQCPIKRGTRYRIKMAKVPVSREKWDPSLKEVIPSKVPAADRYKLDQFFYDKNGKKIGLFRVVFKLFEDDVEDLDDFL